MHKYVLRYKLQTCLYRAWAILEICLSSFWLCMCYAYGGLGASSPREILIFRRSETTSSAFSDMMNSI